MILSLNGKKDSMWTQWQRLKKKKGKHLKRSQKWDEFKNECCTTLYVFADELQMRLWASRKASGKGKAGQLHHPCGRQTCDKVKQPMADSEIEGFLWVLCGKPLPENPASPSTARGDAQLSLTQGVLTVIYYGPTPLLLQITLVSFTQGFLSRGWNSNAVMLKLVFKYSQTFF
jgi:hypothetical protein